MRPFRFKSGQPLLYSFNHLPLLIFQDAHENLVKHTEGIMGTGVRVIINEYKKIGGQIKKQVPNNLAYI